MTTTLEPTGTTRPATTPTRGRHRKQKLSIPRRIARILGTLLVILAGLVLLAMTVGPRVLHYRTATMLTGSMVPTINPGDVIVDTEEPISQLHVGQIITYHIPVEDHRVESHRISWLHRSKTGVVTIRTKGDANTDADPWTARLRGDKVWIVRGVVPYAGTVIRALSQRPVRIGLTIALPAVLILGLLVEIWRKPNDPKSDDTPSSDDSVSA